MNLPHLVRLSGRNESEPVPGVLLLHGRGADEADLMGLERAFDPSFTVVSPRAPLKFGPGFAWYGMDHVGSPHDESLHSSLAQLSEFIDGMIGAYNIDPGALYLVGFSQGAVMSAAVTLTTPQKVQGVVMHSGYVPVESGLSFDLEGAVGKPFFIAHGVYDDVIPVSFARHAREYLTGIGVSLTYQEYPIAHSISEESLDDFCEWLIRDLKRGC